MIKYETFKKYRYKFFKIIEEIIFLNAEQERNEKIKNKSI